MGYLQRFKTFEEADKAFIEEACRHSVDLHSANQFLQSWGRQNPVPYKPGLYRFSSFEEAERFNLLHYARRAAEKKR